MTERQPLWEVVDDAWWSLVDLGSPTLPPTRDQSACVIRALTDWLVAEEPRPSMPEHPDADDFIADGIWIGRQEIRQRLLDEAQRAEVGE